MKEVSFYKNLFEKYIVKKNLDLQDNKDLSSQLEKYIWHNQNGETDAGSDIGEETSDQ